MIDDDGHIQNKHHNNIASNIASKIQNSLDEYGFGNRHCTFIKLTYGTNPMWPH